MFNSPFLRKDLFLSVVIILFFSLDNGMARDIRQTPIQIIQSDDSKFLFEYTLPSPKIKHIDADSNKWAIIMDSNCDEFRQFGQPELPYRAVLIGIPSKSSVNVHILKIKFKTIRKIQLFEHFIANGVQNWDAKGNENLKVLPPSLNGFFPEEIVKVSRPFQWQNRQFVRLGIFPVQYNHMKKQARIVQSVTIEVDYKNSHSNEELGENFSNNILGSLSNLLILNNKISNKWRIRRSRLPKKSRINTTNFWIKMPILKSNVYKLDYSFFQNLGLDSTKLQLNRLHILCGGQLPLAEPVDAPEPKLTELALHIVDVNTDGLLGKGDAILFYAKATTGWIYDNLDKRFRHYCNPYAKEAIYWIVSYDQSPKQMDIRKYPESLLRSAVVKNHFKNHVFGEEDHILPDATGINWMWKVLRGKQALSFSIFIDNPVKQDSAFLIIRLRGLSEEHHLLDVTFNEHLIGSIDLPYKLGKIFLFKIPSKFLETGRNTLSIRSNSSKGSVGFDWYELAYGQALKASDERLNIFAADTVGWTAFRASGFQGEKPWIFDITKPYSVQLISIIHWDSSLGTLTFADSLKGYGNRYLIIVPSKVSIPKYAQRIDYNLLGHLRNNENSADYVIIVPKNLIGSAISRFSKFRRYFWASNGGRMLNILVVTLDEIYNQFSWGLKDPVAIRNFLKYAFYHWKVAPQYVLLVGNATYDIKDNLGAEKKCMVPSFEHDNIVSDDWLVNLTKDRAPDMFIGRLPVNSQKELSVVVDKIINYESHPEEGSWRSRIILAADDIHRNQEYTPQDFVFIRDSEKLANIPEASDFDIRKIYLEQFHPDRIYNKPEAKKTFIEELNTGVLFVNYFGHANWNMMAHENLFRTPSDLAQLHNGARLPIFFAGSCEIARIDDPSLTSMSEYLIRDPEGGNVATIGSARWTMHQASFNVGKEFYRLLFDRNNRGKITIGKALVAAKVLAGFPDQTEAMFLIGDPALRLPISNRQIHLSIVPDSLSLRKRIYVQGTVDDGSKLLTNYSGSCHFCLYDSKLNFRRPMYEYSIPGKILYEGNTSIKNGRFSKSFFVSLDTAQGGSHAKLVTSAWTTNGNADANHFFAIGAKDSLIVLSDSLSKDMTRDTISPDLSLFINGTPISENSSITINLPCTLLGNIYDGQSGFDISHFQKRFFNFQIDGKRQEKLVQSAEIKFQSSQKEGYFRFELNEINLGKHQFSIEVFDKSLNLKKINLSVLVIPGAFALQNVLNYPNPARRKTFFTFQLTQNAEITIKIYTLSGRCIREFQGLGESGFNRFPEDGWDCTDEDLDRIANGVYLYKITAKAIQSPLIKLNNSDRAVAIGKLIIVQ